MFTKLDRSHDNVLGVEIAGEYTAEMEKQFEHAFEEILNNGYDKVHILVKIDQMKVSQISVKAFFKDCFYSLRHLNKLGHMAVVGHSKVQKVLIEVDNWIFKSERKGREERYFDVADMEEAWKFVENVPQPMTK